MFPVYSPKEKKQKEGGGIGGLEVEREQRHSPRLKVNTGILIMVNTSLMPCLIGFTMGKEIGYQNQRKEQI